MKSPQLVGSSSQSVFSRSELNPAGPFFCLQNEPQWGERRLQVALFQLHLNKGESLIFFLRFHPISSLLNRWLIRDGNIIGQIFGLISFAGSVGWIIFVFNTVSLLIFSCVKFRDYASLFRDDKNNVVINSYNCITRLTHLRFIKPQQITFLHLLVRLRFHRNLSWWLEWARQKIMLTIPSNYAFRYWKMKLKHSSM